MRISGVIADVLVAPPYSAAFRSPYSLSSSYSSSLFSYSYLKDCSSYSGPKLRSFFACQTKRGLVMRATGNSGDDVAPVAPLELNSPIGQLLAQILRTHPHLLPAAIDQQLENLQAEKNTKNEEIESMPQDLLYKRIAEVKKKEKQKTLEEILYCLIIQKFVENGISMIPPISATSDPTGRVDFWPDQEQKLESVHSIEAFEMIQSHLSLVLEDRDAGPLNTIIKMSKIKLGKLYAASIMYGYFLKRVDERFQLERSMNTLPKGFTEGQIEPAITNNPLWDPNSLIQIMPDEDYGVGPGDLDEGKLYKLRLYVMYLDAETLQRYATIRSREAISLIEKQTQALFGKPEIRIAEDGSLDTNNDELIALTFSGLTMLVLEAVAFGSFMWDAESYVESKYQFLNS